MSDEKMTESPSAPTVDVEALMAERNALKRKNEELLGEKKGAIASAEALKAQYGGADPEKVNAILAAARDEQEKALLREGKVSEVIAIHRQEEAATHRTALETVSGELETERDRAARLEKENRDLKIRGSAMRAAPEAGARADALEDIARIADEEWSIDPATGEKVAQVNGKEYLGDAGMTEWARDLLERKTYFRAPIVGDGVTSRKTPGGGPDTDKATWENLTERGKLYRDNRAKYDELEARYGAGQKT